MPQPPRLGQFPSASPIPVRVPAIGTLDERLAAVAARINDTARLNSVPSFAAIILTDANGQQWRVVVDTVGQLRTDLVPVRP